MGFRVKVEGADTIDLSIRNLLIRELRSNFMQIFGSTWCMDKNMSLNYEYTEGISIEISLKDDPVSPNYIWVEFSDKLSDFLKQLNEEWDEERLQVSQERYIKINFASSGQQEAVWILNVLFYYLLMGEKTYFIIEEPESHLYPTSQKLITELITLVKNAGNQVMLTTHSPYILGTINNLLYAHKISKTVEQESLEKIIPKSCWLDFKNLMAYYVSNGKIISCLDEEFESIENEIIDGASEDIERDYNKMILLKCKYEGN